METINKKFVCFTTSIGNLAYLHWDSRLESIGVENSHRALVDYLINMIRGFGELINCQCRYCGFYTEVEGNGITHRFYYGESSDYYHLYADDADNEYEVHPDDEFIPSIEVARRFKELLNNEHENEFYAQVFFESFSDAQYMLHEELGQWL